MLCGPPATTGGGGITANTKQCSVVVSEIFSILQSGDDVLSIASNLCFNIIQVIYHNWTALFTSIRAKLLRNFKQTKSINVLYIFSFPLQLNRCFEESLVNSLKEVVQKGCNIDSEATLGANECIKILSFMSKILEQVRRLKLHG